VALSANLSELFVSLQGEGLHVGRRHLFLRLAGCPLRCRYCDTPASLRPVSEWRIASGEVERRRANPIAAEVLDQEIAAAEAAAGPLHALAVTGGEPLAQAEFLAAWLPRRGSRLPVLLETAGVLPDRLRRVLPHVDIVSLDFKCPSNTGERARWDEHEACVVAAVTAGCEVYVKMPVDEGTAEVEVAHGAALIARVAPSVPLLLTPLTEPVGTALAIGAAALTRLHRVAAERHADVRVLPQMHKMLGVP
jgi:organic radical activating enzyme